MELSDEQVKELGLRMREFKKAYDNMVDDIIIKALTNEL